MLAKIRLLVFFRDVFLSKFIFSTSFKSLDFLLIAELYVNPPRIQKALERYFEGRISWLVLAGWRVPCSYNFRRHVRTQLASASNAYLHHTRGHPI